MRKRIALLLALGMMAGAAWAMTNHYSSGATGLSVTQANLNTAFTDNHSGGTAAAFQARHVLIRSRSTSADTCHFDLGDGVATTGDTALAPGASLYLAFDSTSGGAGGGWNSIGAICGAGDTATWDVDAWR